MSSGHNHAPANFGRAFAIGILLNTTFVILEAVFGVLSHSLALVADAGHNLSDVLGLFMAWGASVLARRKPTERRTYGWRRTSILAALFNALFLLVAIGGVIWEAVQRFGHPTPVVGMTVIWVASIGIIINSFTAFLFLSGREKDVNIRGAFLHMAADAGISLGVVIAGVTIMATGWLWLDSAVSLIIAGIILWGTWGLLRESVELAIDAVPQSIDPAAVSAYLASLPGVASVHDLHIWGMSTTETALTAHLVIPRCMVDDAFLENAAQELHDRFEIEHSTLQIERGDTGSHCSLRPHC
jgi:cobalt-zinc-cadmium efflux system protein